MSRRTGFTLIELIVVCAIIVILIVLVVPAVTTIGRGSAITNAGSMLVDQLNLARQTALTQNRMVEVRFYLLPAETGSAEAVRAFELFLYDEAGRTTSPLGKINHFPTGVVAMADVVFSTILSDETNDRGPEKAIVPALNDREVHYKSLRFRPGGATDLNPNGTSTGDKWFVSVRSENDAVVTGRPANNYMTVMLDPVSGRIRTFRP